jgi:transcriptional regulator with XRE-family HTH domain
MAPNAIQITRPTEGNLVDLGERIARIRLSRNLKQAALAKEAGASLRSVKRLEAGENTSLDTFIRVLNVLGLGDFLLNALPDPNIRPVERVTRKGRERQRARDQSEGPATKTWSWGDEGDE